MADLFVDHGAYGGAEIVGSISGTTLTVTSVTSGRVLQYAELVGPGITEGTYITNTGAGGGTGAYTISASHTVAAGTSITLQNGSPLATPVWGTPQEGDGSASTPATASATVSIDLTGATAAAGNTLSVMGATLTCVASGAGVNQFNAGSGSTLAANLATAINRTTNTSTVAAQATGWPTPKVQDAVYARATGATLEIMTRAGSATYNGLSAIAWTGISGMAGPYTWAGGSGGCWGTMVSTFNMWPSAIAHNSYGLLSQAVRLAGPLVAGDVVKIRSGKVLRFRLGGMTVQLPAVGSNDQPVRYVIDDSTVWSDGSEPQVFMDQTATNTGGGFSVAAGGVAHLIASRYSDTKYGLVMRKLLAIGGNDVHTISCAGKAIFEGVSHEWHSTTSGDQIFVRDVGTSNSAGGFLTMRRCRISRRNTLPGPSASGSNIEIRFDFIDCIFEVREAVTPVLGSIYAGSNNIQRAVLNFDGCRFIGFPVGSRLQSLTTTVFNVVVNLRNCDLGGITLLGPDLFGAGVPLSSTCRANGIFISNVSGGRLMVQNTAQSFIGWEPDRSYPTLNARLMDGVTPWSLRMIPSSLAGVVSPMGPVESPRLAAENSLGTNLLTITVEVLVDNTLAWDKSDLSCVLHYIDAAGAVQVIDTYDPDGGALSASTAAWSSTTFSDGGTISYEKRKFTFSTPTAVLANSEISAYVRILTTVSDSTKGIFVDPAVQVEVTP